MLLPWLIIGPAVGEPSDAPAGALISQLPLYAAAEVPRGSSAEPGNDADAAPIAATATSGDTVEVTVDGPLRRAVVEPGAYKLVALAAWGDEEGADVLPLSTCCCCGILLLVRALLGVLRLAVAGLACAAAAAARTEAARTLGFCSMYADAAAAMRGLAICHPHSPVVPANASPEASSAVADRRWHMTLRKPGRSPVYTSAGSRTYI